MTYKSIDTGMLEAGDEIVFFSNGMDFKCIYDLWEELKEYAESKGIKCIQLKPRNDFLYDILDRVSCWCCRNKNQWELYNIWYYFPNTYWKQLLELQSKISSPFRQPNKDGKYGFTLFELQNKFESGYVPKRRKKIIK